MNKKGWIIFGVIIGVFAIVGIVIGNFMLQKSQQEVNLYDKIPRNDSSSTNDNNNNSYSSFAKKYPSIAENIVRQECISQLNRLGVIASEENISTCMKIAVKIYAGGGK